MQTPLQSANPWSQTHLLPLQVWLAEQVTPQPPQLAGSVEVSVQALPHVLSGEVQLAAHTPRSQSCPAGQATAQPPQLSGSLLGLTQLEPHEMSPVAQPCCPPSVPATPPVPEPPVPPTPASVPPAPALASAPPRLASAPALPPELVVALLELLQLGCKSANSKPSPQAGPQSCFSGRSMLWRWEDLAPIMIREGDPEKTE